MAKPDYYATLQVHTEADREVIGAAYRRLAAKYHPDVNTSPDAADQMKRLNEAYEVLSDPVRRAAYDRSRGMTFGGGLGSGGLWRRLVVPVGLVLFIVVAAKLGIRAALLMLVLAMIIWVAVKLWK
ncbi:MAG TPA: DnaJ domain-containing protein [Atribacteraceae bacterium]|nr:DnaJ domain-containing protein [Atribacteraceae bacterium]